MQFTIAIPVRNGEKYLRNAITSALNQSRPADEIIAVDDGSSDSTAAILTSPEWGGRIKYFYNEKPSGYADAVNRVMSNASGDFVTVLDHDDLLDTDYLLHITSAAAQFPKVKHFYSGCSYIDENGSILKSTPAPHTLEPVLFDGKEYAKRYLHGVVTNNHIHRCPGVTTNRSLFLKKCSYRREAGFIPDDDFFYRIGAFTDVIGISQPLASARLHGSSLTSSEKLSLQLSRDYIVQTRNYLAPNSVFDWEDIQQFHRQAVRFINLSLYQSLIHRDDDWFRSTLALKAEFDELVNGLFSTELPLWGRILWLLVEGEKGKMKFSRNYAVLVQYLSKMKSLVKNGR